MSNKLYGRERHNDKNITIISSSSVVHRRRLRRRRRRPRHAQRRENATTTATAAADRLSAARMRGEEDTKGDGPLNHANNPIVQHPNTRRKSSSSSSSSSSSRPKILRRRPREVRDDDERHAKGSRGAPRHAQFGVHQRWVALIIDNLERYPSHVRRSRENDGGTFERRRRTKRRRL